MTNEQARNWSIVLIIVCVVAGFILLIDIGIKNTILQKAEEVKRLYGEALDGAAEAVVAGNSSNGNYNTDVRMDVYPRVETDTLPKGGHDEDKTVFPSRDANGRNPLRAAGGHTSVPPSDE